MKKITVYCEVKDKNLTDVSYELITKAYELKRQAKFLTNEIYKVEAIALAFELDGNEIKKAYQAGADKFVLIKEYMLSTFIQTTYAQCFVDYFKKEPAQIILFPATLTARMVAPRITTYLNTGLVADCIGIEFITKDTKLMLASTRPTFGAELMATILSKSYPQCATVRPETFRAVFNNEPKGEYEEYVPNPYHEPRLRFIRDFVADKSSENTDLASAKIVFCAGFGIVQGKDDTYIKKLEHITKTLNINLAGTRKVVDMGLLSHDFQIGQTGTAINADLYVGFGVSGAIQHTCAMKNSKKIIAINTDEKAEIFKYCDYKIVSDAKKIIDEIYNSIQ